MAALPLQKTRSVLFSLIVLFGCRLTDLFYVVIRVVFVFVFVFVFIFVLFGTLACLTDLFYVVIRVRGDPEKVRPVFHPAKYNYMIFGMDVYLVFGRVYLVFGAVNLGWCVCIWDNVFDFEEGVFGT